MKRLFDVVASLIILAVGFIPMALIALLVRIKLGSPVIFSQMRAGKDGGAFKLMKFRTMTNTLDNQGSLLPDDQRLVGFGRLLRSTSLDELPGLFNVIKGDMSLVGPRPLLMEYLPLYSQHQARRHNVRPGITGWAQVNGRNTISWQEKFDLDVWYVDNRSFWLDLKILFMTVWKVFRRADISHQDHVTMEKFTGNE